MNAIPLDKKKRAKEYDTVMTKEHLNSLFIYRDGMIFWNVPANPRTFGKRAGCTHKLGYRSVKMNKIYYAEHRIIYTMIHGDIPEEMHIDHKNGIKSDNNIENLRMVTRSQNMQNRLAWLMSFTGIKGVYRNKKRWCAKICRDGKDYHLGTFDTQELAQAAYQGAAIVLHGEHANFGKIPLHNS